MYSKKIESILKQKGIELGDKISYDGFTGIFMPQTELGDPDNLIIKLNSGYNIGLKFDESKTLSLVEKGKSIIFKPSEIVLPIDEKKPTVSILGCGGTIASRVEYTTGAVFPAFSPSDFVSSFPKLKEYANMRSKKLFDLLSEDMTPEHWKVIAREVKSEIEAGSDGIVLMHGTDTMQYTACALSFMLQNLSVPVILVGAQRSSDRASSDNELNLLSAVYSAANIEVADVMVCMHESINDKFCALHPGTRVQKMHTSRRDAFKTIGANPYARVDGYNSKIEMINGSRVYRKKDKKRPLVFDDRINPNVGMVWIHPSIKPEFIESLSKFYEGIVLVGTGLGHVPTNPKNDPFTRSIVPAIKSLTASNIPVVMAPQTIYGRINMNVYTAGRMLLDAGVIGNYCDWTPAAALVKLMFVLGHTKEMGKIKEMMELPIAGEITTKSIVL